MYTNADQFVNKRDDLQMFICDDKPDVIMITEVIPKGQINPIADCLLEIEGYEFVANFNPNEANLGASGIRGVAIYYKEEIQKVNEIKFDLPGFRDHVWIDIPTGTNDSILCGCIYRSPSDSDVNACLASTTMVTELIHMAYQRNSNLIITGDFNYKDIDWSNDFAPPRHKYLLNFIETIQDCFLSQHVTEPTRYRENETPNTLDLIFSSEEGMVTNLSYHPPLGESDHVCLRFNVLATRSKSRFTPSHNIHKSDYEAIREALVKYDWHELLNSNFVSDYQHFFDILSALLKEHTPLSMPPKKKNNMYMTNEAIRLKNAKLRAWKRYVSTRARRDRVAYIQCKNKLRAMTRILRKDFEQSIALSIKDKPKVFWKYARSKLKSRQSVPTLRKQDGSLAISAKDKADTLNTFFSSVFTVEDTENVPVGLPQDLDEKLSFITITPEIVASKLRALNSNKSQGHDQWHPHFLKELANTIHPFAHFIQ